MSEPFKYKAPQHHDRNMKIREAFVIPDRDNNQRINVVQFECVVAGCKASAELAMAREAESGIFYGNINITRLPPRKDPFTGKFLPTGPDPEPESSPAPVPVKFVKVEEPWSMPFNVEDNRKSLAARNRRRRKKNDAGGSTRVDVLPESSA